MKDIEGEAVELSVDAPWFDSFISVQEPRLRRALVAANGVQIGNDACADALAWAWEHRDRVLAMDHPVAYLFRVGQSSARRHRRWRQEVSLPAEPRADDVPEDSGRLDVALRSLNRKQRTVVILVHAHGWTYGEVAEALSVSVAAVRNHLHRGMKQLRENLECS